MRRKSFGVRYLILSITATWSNAHRDCRPPKPKVVGSTPPEHMRRKLFDNPGVIAIRRARYCVRPRGRNQNV
jgi:hypothetical protein